MELTRKQLQAMFPGLKLKIRMVSFADLARDYAYFFTVYESDGVHPINGHGFYTRESVNRYQEVFKEYALKTGDGATYKGKRLIAS